MNKIIHYKEDPYLDLYKFEKMQNPDKVINMRPFRRQDVADVDKLVEISRGNRETVKTEEDWNVLANLIVFFIQRWPQEWMDFRSSIPQIRGTRGSGGYSKSKEIKYMGAIPQRLERLIKIIFPMNKFDKKFANQFIKRFKVFQIGGEGN